jgi:2-(1,2-epoxy-1,2-dihydrophenyl)acetyl-CoA isomerase
MKAQAYSSFDTDLETALETAAANQIRMLGTQDHIEAVAAWLEKRKPDFKGK